MEILIEYFHVLSVQVRSKSGDSESELRMIVHQSQAGCIIGRQGFKVKELREVRVIWLFSGIMKTGKKKLTVVSCK